MKMFLWVLEERFRFMEEWKDMKDLWLDSWKIHWGIMVIILIKSAVFSIAKTLWKAGDDSVKTVPMINLSPLISIEDPRKF